MRKLILACAASALISSSAYSSEASDKAEGIVCKDAGDFVKVLKKLDKLKPNQIDTVGMTPVMQFTVLDGGALPSRVYYRYKGAETPFHINSDGYVTDFTKIKTMHKKGEMCMQDKTRLGADEDEHNLNLTLNMDLVFHNVTGVYSLAELQDGLKDGRAHIKKIVPGPVSLLIPKFTHFSISSENDDIPVKIAAYKDGAKLTGLTVLKLGSAQIVEYKQLKALGADSLHISGAGYKISPMPSPDVMDKLGGEE